jgi:hypothetical protein
MDLATRKIHLMQEFLKVESEDIISKLEKILSITDTTLQEKDFKPMSLDEFKNRIETSMNESSQGNLKSSTDLKLEVDQWK